MNSYKVFPFLKWLSCGLSGLMLACGFPPFKNLGILLLFALIPILGVLWTGDRASSKKDYLKLFFYGWIMGVVFYGTSLFWVNEVSTLGYVPLVMYLALYPGVWALFIGGLFRPNRSAYHPSNNIKDLRRFRQHWTNRDVLITLQGAFWAGTLWCALEWLRSLGNVSLPWNMIGIGLPVELAQTAEYIGGMGLSFFPVFTSAVLWSIGSRLVMTVMQDGRRSLQYDFFLLVLIWAGLFMWGQIQISQVNSTVGTVRFNFLCVQQNIPQEIKSKPELQSEFVQKYLDLTSQGYEQIPHQAIERLKYFPNERVVMENPDVVIWPETSFHYSLLSIEGQNQYIIPQYLSGFAEQGWKPFSKVHENVPLIAGVDEVVYGEESPHRFQSIMNTMHVFVGDLSKNDPSYTKKCLVPFGEYIPLRDSLPFLEKAFEYSAGVKMGKDYSRGSTRNPLIIATPKGQLSIIPTICFEDTVLGHARTFVRSEKNMPQIMVNMTNDGWFNHSFAAEQHFLNARMRSIELRRPLVRAANTGVTALVGADGFTADVHFPEQKNRELRTKDGSSFLAGTLYASVLLPLVPPMTLYAVAGNWFSVLCLILFSLACILKLFRIKFDHLHKNEKI